MKKVQRKKKNINNINNTKNIKNINKAKINNEKRDKEKGLQLEEKKDLKDLRESVKPNKTLNNRFFMKLLVDGGIFLQIGFHKIQIMNLF